MSLYCTRAAQRPFVQCALAELSARARQAHGFACQWAKWNFVTSCPNEVFARAMGCSVRTVQRALGELRRAGLMKQNHPKSKGCPRFITLIWKPFAVLLAQKLNGDIWYRMSEWLARNRDCVTLKEGSYIKGKKGKNTMRMFHQNYAGSRFGEPRGFEERVEMLKLARAQRYFEQMAEYEDAMIEFEHGLRVQMPQKPVSEDEILPSLRGPMP
jgi:hypothetical protein